jgi:ubiquinone/menaquinone biosynthesis C-methylase UbiE
MDDWIDYYDSTHTIYASRLHRDVHFELIAREIIAYIPAPDAVVLDYACGEALSASRVAADCGRLILAEPAPGVRARLTARFAAVGNIEVRSLDELGTLQERSLDLAVMNSVAQYMTEAELDGAFALIRRLLKPDGKLIVGDILEPDAGMSRDIAALIQLAWQHGFLKDALWGLVRTALSDYRQLRTRIGLKTYSEATLLAKLSAAGFAAVRAPDNIGHNRWRMTFIARPPASATDAVEPLRLTAG